MKETPIEITLASGSPRRKELCLGMGFLPQVQVSQVAELRSSGESIVEYTRRLAQAKASAVRQEGALHRWILAADTVVILDEELLEKPLDQDDATHMLQQLSGRWHKVVTAFCWLDSEHTTDDYVEHVTTEVRFAVLSPSWIRRYVQSGAPLDKAGAYGIQGFASTMIPQIRGSYSNVVGLPVHEVYASFQQLRGLG